MWELKKSHQFSIWTPVSPLHIMLTNVQKDKHSSIVNLTFDPLEIKCHHLIYPSRHLWEILYICNLLLNKLHLKKNTFLRSPWHRPSVPLATSLRLRLGLDSPAHTTDTLFLYDFLFLWSLCVGQIFTRSLVCNLWWRCLAHPDSWSLANSESIKPA